MILTVKTADLKTALAPYKKVLKSKSLFILQGIKLSANKENQTLTIEGTDLELALRTVIKADVTENGTVVATFKNLDNLANLCKDETISLKSVKGEKDEDILQIYKLKLNTFAAEEFPVFPELNPDGLKQSKNLNLKSFIEALSKTVDFASKDQSRVALTGFLLDTKSNSIAATDSFKLAVAGFDFKANLEKEPEKEIQENDYNTGGKGIIMPSKVYELLKLFKNNETAAFNIAIDKENQSISFVIANLTIVSCLMQGKFPGYEKLIPEEQNFNYSFKINAKEVIGILDEANKLLDNKDNLPIKISSQENKLIFSMMSREIGNYESEVKVDTLKNENKDELIFAVDPSFLKICLKNLENPTLSIVEPLKPIVLQEETNSDLKILLMPIRIN